MSKLTIIEAVKRSGVSRTTFTNRYLKTGLVTALESDGKKYIKTAELTKAMATVKKKAPVKSTTKPKLKATTSTKSAAKKAAIAKPDVKTKAKAASNTKPLVKEKTVTKARPAAKTTPKASAKIKTPVRSKPISVKEKLTDIEMYKLKIKQLRAQLKTATSDNELLQKENESLGRKNVNLSRRLTTSPTKAKPATKPKTKPPIITLSLPDVTPEKSIQETKHKPRQRKDVSDNEHWVDKWWDGF